MDGEAEEERLEPETVRGAAIAQAEPRDDPFGPVDRRHREAELVHLEADDGLDDLVARRGELERAVWLIGPEAGRRRPAAETRAAEPGKEHAPHAAQYPDGRQHGFDERKAQLRVGEEPGVADELEEVVAAQFRVAAEEEEVGHVADALEPFHAERGHAVAADALVVAGVAVEGLARQRVADLRRHLVGQAIGAAGQRAVLAKDRRLVHERGADRHGGAVVEDAGAEVLLLELVGEILQGLVAELVVEVRDAAKQLDPRVTRERVDAKHARAVDGPRGHGIVAAQEEGERRVVEARLQPVEELGLREALDGVLEALRQVGVREGERAELRHRGGKEREVLVAEHVAEGDGGAAEDVTAARHAEVDRRPSVQEQLLEPALHACVGRDERVRQRRLEVHDRAGLAEVGGGRRDHRLREGLRVQAVFALVIGHKGHPPVVGVGNDHRRDDAGERVGVLAEVAVAQVERPQVEDLAVADDLGVDHGGRIGGRRGKDEGVGVEELRGRLVVGAEGQLRLGAARQVEPEQLVVAADAREVDERVAVRRDGRRVVGEAVAREVAHLARLEVDLEDVTDGVPQGREVHPAAVERELGRLGRIHAVEIDAVLNLARDDVHQDERALLLGAGEVGEAVAPRRPRDPRHRVPARTRDRDELVAAVLAEARRQVAHDLTVLGRDEHDVEFAVLAVAEHGGQQVARGRWLDGQQRREPGLARVGREVAPVVGRPFLVAERLEPVLHVRVELLVELVGRDAQRLLEGALAAADGGLAQREQELADALLAPALLDELEGCVPQVVDQAGVGKPAVAVELAHGRDDVGHGGVAHRHQVERPPDAGHVVGQPFVHPQRHAAAHERARDDVELEDVGEFVGDEAVELVGRLVNRHEHPVAGRLGKGRHALAHGARNDVLLLELALRLEDEQRDLLGEVVLQFGTELLVGALGVAGDALEVLFGLGVVVDLEVVGRVDRPSERVVSDLVLAEVRHKRGLRCDGGGPGRKQQGHGHVAPPRARQHMHTVSLGWALRQGARQQTGPVRNGRHGTSEGPHPQRAGSRPGTAGRIPGISERDPSGKTPVARSSVGPYTGPPAGNKVWDCGVLPTQ